MMYYMATGSNGSYFEYGDGTFVDTVAGDSRYAPGTAVPDTTNMDTLQQFAQDNGAELSDRPILADWSDTEANDYVGA